VFSQTRRLTGLALVGLLGLGVAAEGAPPFTIAPPGAWVDELAPPGDGAIPSEQVAYGTYYLIDDFQARVAETTARYYRQAWKVLSTAGVQEASEIRIGFDPSYQRLVIHHVRLWRERRNVRSFKAADVNVIHQEDDLSERIYNGSLSALVFLKDVRPGDVVDYAYTLEGANPLLGGRYVGTVRLAYSVPVRYLRYRLLLPSTRTLRVKPIQTSIEPVVRDANGTRTYLWETTDVPAVDADEEVPGWYDPHPRVQLSEFGSWNEVARWANVLFSSERRPSKHLSALAAEWRSAGGDEEARALRAIRFVQDEIRYLGIEMGLNSHRPHRLDEVLAQRFGDCKDKALLLTTLFGELGIDAVPALVNTEARHALDDYQPSPFQFDHAIVQARIAGKTVWIDATRSERGGPPTSWEPPDFERALLVKDDTESLTAIPGAPRKEPSRVVEETYTVASWTAPVRLTVHTTYTGPDADDKRQALARMSPADVAKRYLSHYAQDDPGVRALAPPSFKDDRTKNLILAEERYELPGFWKDKRHEFYGWAVGQWLRKPAPLRTMPLEVAHPVHVLHKLVVELPEPITLEPQAEDIREGAFVFRARAEPRGRTLNLTYSYQPLGSSLPAAETSRYRNAIERAENALGYTIDRDARPSPGVARASDGRTGWAGLGLLVATVLGLGAIAIRGRRTRERRAFWRTRPLVAGESAASALPVSSDGEISRLVETLDCGCGAGCSLSEEERHSILYDGQPMTVVGCRCQACGREQALYVVASP
jgi:hypothetical protein